MPPRNSPLPHQIPPLLPTLSFYSYLYHSPAILRTLLHITLENYVDIHALRRQSWTITASPVMSAGTVRRSGTYLNGIREPGVRQRAVDPFAPFLEYVTARLIEDPHLWAITLFDELEALGFEASYQTLTREVRARRLRPVCADCGRATKRPNAIIPHPAGEETQWTGWTCPTRPPPGVGSMAHLLVGSLAHSVGGAATCRR